MQEKRTPIFQKEDGSWGHVTHTVNPLICTIEYKCHPGFPSKEEAEESYQKSQDAYSSQIQQLKKSRKIPFTFSEYLDYWFREVYTPYSTSKSTLFKYRWVLYQSFPENYPSKTFSIKLSSYPLSFILFFECPQNTY